MIYNSFINHFIEVVDNSFVIEFEKLFESELVDAGVVTLKAFDLSLFFLFE